MIYETLPEEVGTSLAHDHPGGYTTLRGTTARRFPFLSLASAKLCWKQSARSFSEQDKPKPSGGYSAFFMPSMPHWTLQPWPMLP